ncbi:MAG TPA: class I SAM-dependent methyltransferase [Bryobacteraceae bacterium]|nr:class I SAM-dependent methyltransferase [Bryobacteraceae bacterium]
MLAQSQEAAGPADPVYKFKASAYSSHGLILNGLPKDGEGKTVLDVGCGNGYLGGALAARGFQVTGVERRGGYSEAFPASVRLIEADLEAGLPALHEVYDYVLCADILEHLRRPEELLTQVRAVLKPGGELIASLPNSGHIYFRLNVLAGRFPQEDKGLFDRTHIRFYTWHGWQSLLERAGFRITSMRPTAIPFELVIGDSGPVRAAEHLYFEAARLWKSLLAYQFVTTAMVEGRDITQPS